MTLVEINDRMTFGHSVKRPLEAHITLQTFYCNIERNYN